MAFNKYLFIEDLTGANGNLAQADALAKVEQLIDRDFQTERECELEEIYSGLCDDFDLMEEQNGVLWLQVADLKKQLAESKGEKYIPFDFALVPEKENYIYAEI